MRTTRVISTRIMKQSHSLDMLPLVRGASLLYHRRDDYGVAIAAAGFCYCVSHIDRDSLRHPSSFCAITRTVTRISKMESETLQRNCGSGSRGRGSAIYMDDRDLYASWRQVVKGVVRIEWNGVGQITCQSLRKYVPVEDNTCNLTIRSRSRRTSIIPYPPPHDNTQLQDCAAGWANIMSCVHVPWLLWLIFQLHNFNTDYGR